MNRHHDLMEEMIGLHLIDRAAADLWWAQLRGPSVKDANGNEVRACDWWLVEEWRRSDRSTPEAIAAYYDSDLWMAWQDDGGAWFDPPHSQVSDVPVETAAGKRVLDFGCGGGKVGRGFLGVASSVSFVDASPRLLAGIKSMCGKRGYEVDVATRLDDLAGPFDIVFAIDVFEHVVDPQAVIRRLVDLMPVGGLLYQEVFFTSHESVPYHLIDHYHTDEQWRAACLTAGLVPEKLHHGNDGFWRKA